MKSKSTKGLNTQTHTRKETGKDGREILLKFIQPPCVLRILYIIHYINTILYMTYYVREYYAAIVISVTENLILNSTISQRFFT